MTYSGKITAKFYDAISKQNWNEFVTTVWESTCIIILSSILNSISIWIIDYLSLCFRRSSINEIHKLYFNDKILYQSNEVMNIDQRICQDISDWCNLLSSLYSKLITCPIIIVYYTYLNCINTSFYLPLMIIIYFIITWTISRILMSPLINFSAIKENNEGDFRHFHSSVRNNRESIAIFDGYLFERNRAEIKFNNLVNIILSFLKWDLILQIFTGVFSYFGSILNYTIIGLYAFYINGISSSNISYYSFLSLQLIYGFTLITSLSKDISEFIGINNRIYELLTYLTRDEFIENNINNNYQFSLTCIEFKNVTMFFNENKIINNLSFEINTNDFVLLVGNPGCGKSTIFKILKGILIPTYGTVITNVEDIYYLPQKTYVPEDCTLEEMIAYPHLHIDKQKIDNLKLIFNLYSITSTENLSDGEKQIISFCRLLYNKPKYVVLDEFTSSVNEEIEDKMYSILKNENIKYLSIGHKSSLNKYHTRIININS